jgi:hypothetical protein
MADVQPFYIYPLDEEEAHLCPVRAMAEWIKASQVTSGFLFRRFMAHDRPSAHEDTAMVSHYTMFYEIDNWLNSQQTSEKFLELFRNNLLDINVDPYPYGTHSFRRGGCQYLASDRRWSLRTICEWGGWSTEFSNLTIVRYLISANDNPMQRRQDFFNPKKRPALKCFQCGRCCYCA